MEKRGVINSKTIRENLPKVYEDFFSRCQIVVSTSDSFFWVGAYARFFGGLSIQQKLPTKNLVGLEIIDEEKFCFADKLYGYNTITREFDDIKYDHIKETRLNRFLKEYWPQLEKTGKIKGFRIHILSESHCGGGLGTAGTLMSCLATAMMILSKNLTIQEVKKWEDEPVQELLDDEGNKNFWKTFRLAWRLMAISRSGHSSGATSFAAFLKTAYPILYFSDNVSELMEENANDTQCEFIDKAYYWGGKMEEIFLSRMPQPWPVDMARVYSGHLINTESIFRIFLKASTDMKGLKNSVEHELLGKKIIADEFAHIFGFLSKEKNAYEPYIKIFKMLAVKLLLSFNEMFNLGPDQENMQKFFYTVRQIKDLDHFLGHSTPLLDKVLEKLDTMVADNNEYNMAASLIEGIGKGGHLVFTGPAGMMPENINSEISKMAKETGKNIYLDWASWIDGYSEDGLIVEQYLSENIYSEFTSTECLALISYCQGKSEKKIIDCSKKEEIYKNFDLVLDEVERKIIIKGEVLSSKDIPSTKATIDILKKIIESVDCKIGNGTLANTAYGNNRYDLQSKIVIPLNKALEKNKLHKINFTIHGGMYEDYSIGADLKNIKLAIIENIGSSKI